MNSNLISKTKDYRVAGDTPGAVQRRKGCCCFCCVPSSAGERRGRSGPHRPPSPTGRAHAGPRPSRGRADPHQPRDAPSLEDRPPPARVRLRLSPCGPQAPTCRTRRPQRRTAEGAEAGAAAGPDPHRPLLLRRGLRRARRRAPQAWQRARHSGSRSEPHVTATLAADWSAWGEAGAAPDPRRLCAPRWLPGNRESALKLWFPGPGLGFSRVYREAESGGKNSEPPAFSPPNRFRTPGLHFLGK
nr:TANK-binding kinase 1-binding protein 1-like [Globicephala melas]